MQFRVSPPSLSLYLTPYPFHWCQPPRYLSVVQRPMNYSFIVFLPSMTHSLWPSLDDLMSINDLRFLLTNVNFLYVFLWLISRILGMYLGNLSLHTQLESNKLPVCEQVGGFRFQSWAQSRGKERGVIVIALVYRVAGRKLRWTSKFGSNNVGYRVISVLV